MRWPNDWNIRDCLLLCGSITVLQIVLTLLSQAGIEVYALRQVTGFVFITFVPGILLLRIFKIHDINTVESIVYSVGLSLALVMFSGAALNFLLSVFHFVDPITLWPLLIILVAETAILIAVAWVRDRDHKGRILEKELNLLHYANPALFLIILILLVILGVKLSDITGNNLMLIISLLMVALIICLAAFKKIITPEIYPFAIFAVSLCLLYQTSLMSPYLVGTDIYTEYQHYRATLDSGNWAYAIPNPVNSCLSIVILGPLYTLMTGIDGIWVFKAVYPILFSLLPLIMYRIFRIQIGALRSFLAVFFFMSVPTFSLEMVSLCRQQIAEVFFGLFILLLVERKINIKPKIIMLVLFTLSILVSHYSLSFITLIYLALLIPLVLLLRSNLFLNFWAKTTSRTGGLPELYKESRQLTLPAISLIIPVVFYWALGVSWYLLVAGGINYIMLSGLWTSQSSTIAAVTSADITTTHDLLIRAALGMDFFDVTWQGQIFRVLQYVTQLFIIAGCLRLLFMPRGLKFRIEYIAISVLSVAMLAACVKLPNFAYAFNTTRWYHVLLITLAPFFVIGGETLFQLVRYCWDKIRKCPLASLKESPVYLRIITVAIIVPYFIITSGILYETTKMKETTRIEVPFSIALSSYRLDLMGNFSAKDEYAARWLRGNSTKASNIYADSHTWKILLRHEFPGSILTLVPTTKPENGDLLFLTDWNISHNEVTFSIRYPGLRSHADLSQFVNDTEDSLWQERIYSNGATEILKVGR